MGCTKKIDPTLKRCKRSPNKTNKIVIFQPNLPAWGVNISSAQKPLKDHEFSLELKFRFWPLLGEKLKMGWPLIWLGWRPSLLLLVSIQMDSGGLWNWYVVKKIQKRKVRAKYTFLRWHTSKNILLKMLCNWMCWLCYAILNNWKVTLAG